MSRIRPGGGTGSGSPGPPGPKGDPGPPGPPGVAGAEGPQGPPGQRGPEGPAGPAGSQGPAGPKGDPGQQGLTGPKGDPGVPGETGPQGPPGIKGDAGSTGPAGAASTVPGPQGDPGPQGNPGTPGVKGDKGDKGDTGPQGIPGTPGQTGATGAPGPPGPVQFFVPLVVSATAALTNAPAAGVEPAGQMSRQQVDLRSTVNVVVSALFSVAPAVAGVCRVEYSVNGGTNWATLADSGAPALANVLKVGQSAAVPAAAKTATTLLRVMVTGDGVADPVLQKAGVMFQPT